MEFYSSVFNVFSSCVHAIHDEKFIHREDRKDKEFHFQNWINDRLAETDFHYEIGGRNIYPDFRMVRFTEGFEVKGLAYPGRELNFDSNSRPLQEVIMGELFFMYLVATLQIPMKIHTRF